MDDRARRLVETYRSQVVGVTVRALFGFISSGALTMDEAVSEAEYGLCLAADRWPAYCEERGFELDENYFATYASHRAKGAVRDLMRARDPLRRLDREKVKAGLIDQIPQYAYRQAVSLDATLASSETETRPDFVDSSQDTHSTTETTRLLNIFTDAFRKLDDRAQVILALRYYKDMEMRDIAKLLAVSESTVSEEHKEAILMLVEVMRAAASG